ncbi:hypothetical protein GEMRC1_003381 [Eukaryota sp. GEM-RC1]
MSTDNNNYCVPCGAAPCDRVPPHSPRSQDPTMSRFFSDGPALQGTTTSLLEGSALQSPSSVEGSALPVTSEVAGSVPTPQTQQTPSEGSVLQRIPVVEGSALPSQPQEEVITIQEDSPPEGSTLQSPSSTVQINYQDLSPPRDMVPPKDTSSPTNPAFERIRAMFSGAPTPNKPFPTLQLSSFATPTSRQEGFKFAAERDLGLPPSKPLPKATSKSAPIKKSQKGSVPSSLPIVDASSTPRAQDSVPHVGETPIVSHVNPAADPDLEDLCDFDVADDEESGQTPAKGPSDHPQPPPSRPVRDKRGFQPQPIIPVQGFYPVRSTKTGSSELFQAPPGPFQQGLTEEELKRVEHRMFPSDRQMVHDFLHGVKDRTDYLRNRYPRPAQAAIRLIRRQFNDEVMPLEGTYTILDDRGRPHTILMDPSIPETMIPVKKCWEKVQEVLTGRTFEKSNSDKRIRSSDHISSQLPEAIQSTTTPTDEVVIQPTALKYRARVEYEEELARRANANPKSKVKEISEFYQSPSDQSNPPTDVHQLGLSLSDLSTTSTSPSTDLLPPLAPSASNSVVEQRSPMSHSVVTFQQKVPLDSMKNSKLQPKMLSSLKPHDIIEFAQDFLQWSVMDPNHKTPVGAPFGWPRHFFDFSRTAAAHADPSYIQRFVKFDLQTQLSMQKEWDGKNPLTLWLALLKRTQFPDETTALNELNKIKMKWSITDPEERWSDFISRLHRVLQRTQAIKPKNKPMTALPDKAIVKAILSNIGIVSIWIECWPLYQDSPDIQGLISDVKERYDTWCERWKSAPANVQNEQRIAEIAHLRDTATWEDLPNLGLLAPSSRSKPPSKKPRSEEKDPDACRFCGEKGHSILQCPDPECKRSELPLEQRKAKSSTSKPSRSHSKKHSSHKKSKYFNANSAHINSLVDIADNITSSQSNPSLIETNQFLNPLSNISSANGNTNSQSLNSIFSISSQNPLPLLSCKLMINGIPVQGFWDSGATMSVITQDLATKCNMTPVNKNVRFTSANNVESRSLGSAQGILTFDTSSIAYLTHVDKTLPIIPGSNKLLLGIDLMKQLGLLTEDGLVIRIDKAILATVNDESEFDSRIIQPPRSHSIDNIVDFNKHVFDSGCTIKLDDDNRAKSLLSLLQEFSSIFSTAPHKDGIDCPPMAIDFYNEESTVRRKPRRLNPMKQRIAEEIFDELVRQDFAELTTPNGQFSSPVVLVVYPDQRKPRLTGDFSGSDGINALTRVVEPNLPKIIDILEFLSEANFIATLDLPKAFWQLNLAEKDRDKTTLVIPGKAIRFKRACFGLKNVPAIFQNLMYEIFDHEGIFIYIDDIIIVGRTFEEFMSRIRFVLTKALTRRVNLGLPKCNFVTKKHPLKILGSKFVNNTRSIDPSRITALLELPVPTTIKEVRSFVGSINYIKDFYSRCVRSSGSNHKLSQEQRSFSKMDTSPSI